jgi:hypothetical protein
MTDFEEAVRAVKVAALKEAIAAIELYNYAELPGYSDVQMGVDGAIEAINQLIASLFHTQKEDEDAA